MRKGWSGEEEGFEMIFLEIEKQCELLENIFCSIFFLQLIYSAGC